MIDINLDDKIKILNLSSRLYNCLNKLGIKTVGEFMAISKEDLKDIFGLGNKSINELENKINLLEKRIYFNLFEIDDDSIIEKTFINKDGLEYIDITLERLNIDKKVYDNLKSQKVNYYSELIKLTDNELIKLTNFNEVSLDKIKRLNKRVVLFLYDPNSERRGVNKFKFLNKKELQYIFNITSLLNINFYKLLNILKKEYKEKVEEQSFKELNEKGILLLLIEIDIVKIKLVEMILDLIDKETYGIYINDLFEKLPNQFKDKGIFENILNELLLENKINFIYDDRLMIKRESFKTGGWQYLTKRECDIFEKRIAGETLERISETYNVTRERIRQIEVTLKEKLNINKVKYKEDVYKDIFLNYKIEKEDFNLALDNEEIYNYLSLRYDPIPKRNINEILSEDKIPIIIKRKFEKAIYKDYVKIGNERIKASRNDIVNYVLRNYARNDIHFDDFKRIYVNLINNLNIDDQNFILERGYENKFLYGKNVLWKYGKKLRYYNQNIYDFTNLFATLNLNQYSDVEYSTLKFFKLYPELMTDYDIKDEYELHNLLKKICSSDIYPKVTFKRMPNIEFGTADRNKQIKSLLFKLAPISSQGFAKAYEEKYGVIAKTVLANYVSCIEEYYYQGEYIIDFPDIPYVLKEKLIKLLSADFYMMDEMNTQVMELYPDLKMNDLNPRTLKKLGFLIYENYIVSNRYNSAAQYFNSLLTKDDIVDLNTIDSKIKQLVMFGAELYRLKRKYEIIEFSPCKYINFRNLKVMGVNKNMFEDFINQVLNFLGQGQYFTIASLKKMKFYHSLYDLGFENWFYTSILIEKREKISYIKFSKTKIMFTGSYNFDFMKFLENIVYLQKELYIDIDDLVLLLNNYYEIYVDISKLINIIEASTLYYDEIGKRVYGDYDIYYEGI